jgi:hypothetical protein
MFRKLSVLSAVAVVAMVAVGSMILLRSDESEAVSPSTSTPASFSPSPSHRSGQQEY